MTCALYIRVSTLYHRLRCHVTGHEWIVNADFKPAPKFGDPTEQLKFDLLVMGAVLMGLPEFGIAITGVTDIERICARCGRYEKGFQFGEASHHDARTRSLRGYAG